MPLDHPWPKKAIKKKRKNTYRKLHGRIYTQRELKRCFIITIMTTEIQLGPLTTSPTDPCSAQ